MTITDGSIKRLGVLSPHEAKRNKATIGLLILSRFPKSMINFFFFMAHPVSAYLFPIAGSHPFEVIDECHPQNPLFLWERARVRFFF
ncbi:MAG: hypothetical protein ACE15F_15050 [bacterium]